MSALARGGDRERGRRVRLRARVLRGLLLRPRPIAGMRWLEGVAPRRCRANGREFRGRDRRMPAAWLRRRRPSPSGSWRSPPTAAAKRAGRGRAESGVSSGTCFAADLRRPVASRLEDSHGPGLAEAAPPSTSLPPPSFDLRASVAPQASSRTLDGFEGRARVIRRSLEARQLSVWDHEEQSHRFVERNAAPSTAQTNAPQSADAISGVAPLVHGAIHSSNCPSISRTSGAPPRTMLRTAQQPRNDLRVRVNLLSARLPAASRRCRLPDISDRLPA
jgi:hypothetical protein